MNPPIQKTDVSNRAWQTRNQITTGGLNRFNIEERIAQRRKIFSPQKIQEVINTIIGLFKRNNNQE